MNTPEQTIDQQGTHFCVIALRKPDKHGSYTLTIAQTFTPAPGMTRFDAYQWIRGEVTRQYPELAGANVAFFSLEPNQL